MAIAGVDIGQELGNVPMGDMVLNMGLAIADAQWALDKNSMIETEVMSGQQVLRNLDTGELVTYEGDISRDLNKVPVIRDSRVFFGFDIKDNKRIPALASMMELGFTPTFYQFVDTIIEVKIEITLTGGTEKAKANKGATIKKTVDRTEITTRRQTHHSCWWWHGHTSNSTSTNTRENVEVQATPIDATRTSKYSYSAEGSCFIRTKLVPIPPPGILEERIRLVMEQEEWWKQQQKLIAPEEDFEKGLGGLWFNGFDTEVELPTASELGLINRDFTVEAMIRIDEFKGGDETILGTAGSRYSKGLHLVLRNQRMYMGFYGNDLRGKTIVPSDVWCHVAYRYDINKKEQSVFLNGVLDNKAQGHPPFSGNYPVYIGRWLGDSYFNGYIDEIRIWKTARTDEEIKDNSRKQPAKRDDANLTAYWRLTDQPRDKKTIPDLKETAKKLNGALNKPAKAIWSQSVG